MATTIIDFSPAATEITDVIAAPVSGSVTQPLGSIPTAGINTNQLIDTFHSNAPDILFTCEYIVNGKMLGHLVVWEDYYQATHYELFKRNKCAVDQSWQRFIFVDSDTLKTETKNYASYIQNTLGIPMDQNGFYAILDTDNITDRIYEYYLGAGYYPSDANIDFSVIMKSKNLLNNFNINNTDTLDTVSNNAFGTSDMAWVISLLNNFVYFFGPISNSKPLNQFVLSQGYVLVPNNIDDLVTMISESIYMFGLKNTLGNLFVRTKLTSPSYFFFENLLTSVDDGSHTLSYSKLNNSLIAGNSSYKAAQAAGNSANLITSNQYPNDTYFGSVQALSVVFARVNSLLTSYLYGSQELAKSPGHIGTAISSSLIPSLANILKPKTITINPFSKSPLGGGLL